LKGSGEQMQFDFAGHLLVRVSTTVAIFSLLVCGAPPALAQADA